MAKLVKVANAVVDLEKVLSLVGNVVTFQGGVAVSIPKPAADALRQLLEQGGAEVPTVPVARQIPAGPFGGLKALPKLGKDGVLVRLTGPAEMCDAVGTLLKAVFAELGYRAGETKELAPKALPSPSPAPKAPEKPKKVRSLRSRGAPKKAK